MKKLYNYQKQAINKALEHDRFLLALDMGLGKTLCAINWLKQIKQTSSLPTIIICDPLKLSDWFEEYQEQQVTGEAFIVKDKQSIAEFENISRAPNKVFIVSYRRFSNLFNKLNLGAGLNVIIDESQALKSHTSQISKNCFKLSPYIRRLLLLSGDPISTGYINLYPQMRLLNCFVSGYKYGDFLEDFCKYIVMKTSAQPFKMITGYKNTEYLMQLLKTRAYFLKTEQAIELPQKQAFKFISSPTKDYETLKKTKTLATSDWSFTADSVMKLFHGLRMIISGSIKSDQDNIIELNTNKIEQLETLITSSTYNFSVFYNYQVEAQAIKKLCEKLKIKCYEINGQRNDLKLLQNETERFIVIIQYLSGARGVDGLQEKIFNQVYFSLTYSGELHRQSLKRIHRIGQSKPVRYYFLLTKNSVEVNIFNALRTSSDYTLKMFENDLAIGGI